MNRLPAYNFKGHRIKMGRGALIKKMSKAESKEAETTKIETQDNAVSTVKQEETIAIEKEEEIIAMEIKEIDNLVEKQIQSIKDVASIISSVPPEESRDYQAFRVQDYEDFKLPQKVQQLSKSKKIAVSPAIEEIKKPSQLKSPNKITKADPKVLRVQKQMTPPSEITAAVPTINPFTYIEKVPTHLLDDPKFSIVVQEVVLNWQMEYRKRVNIETRLKNKTKEHNDGYVKLLENMVEEWQMRYESERLRQNQLLQLSKDNDLLKTFMDKFK